MPQTEGTETVGPQTSPAGAPASRLGSVVAERYELRALLGKGGHATVYRAFDRLLGTEVALKLFRPLQDPESGLARIRREVGVARESLSPHLLRVFDFGESRGDLYLTMEILEGGSLRDKLQQGSLPKEEALEIAKAVFRGLAALHGQGVVHRDVTPGNVLFNLQGEAKLGDFGLVRRLGAEESVGSLGEGVLGTMGYLAPEQLMGGEVGPRSDLYAAGVVLFEMLTGRRPQEAASELGLRLAPLMEAPGLRQLSREIPGWLAATVARLLARRPEDRFSSAETVLAVLERRRMPPRPRLRRWLARTAAVLVVGALAAWLLVPARGQGFSHLVPAGESGIAAISVGGQRLWTVGGVLPEIAERAALARITPNGPRLIAIVLARPDQWNPEAISTLSFLDPKSGKSIRNVQLPSGVDFFPNWPPRFSFASAKAADLDDDGVDEVFVNFSHVPEAPFYTVLYAPRLGQARVVYYSIGGQDFQGAVDLDGDGTRELLFAGINNGWNWVNTVAAVRFDPGSLRGSEPNEVAAAPDAMERAAQLQKLLWYAVVPRGHLESYPRLEIDAESQELNVRYRTGVKWTLGYDGFPPGPPGQDRAQRQAARIETYGHLREAERLRRAGDLGLATTEAQAAFEAAARAQETWLQQYASRLEARILVSRGELAQAEGRFSSLIEAAEDAPEVAYDAAVAFHLQGDLQRAVTWYVRGMGRGSAIGAGKSKHEFLKGQVLALVEERRYAEALDAVERFGATYPPFRPHLWMFREYVRWRAGGHPVADRQPVPSNWPDLERYWELELDLAEGRDTADLLSRTDRYLAERPETRAQALSLRAELLAIQGRVGEASAVAQNALELARAESPRSIIARAHLGLIQERAQRLRNRIASSASQNEAARRLSG